MNLGLFPLGGTLLIPVQTVNGSNVPTDADAVPSFKIYDESGLVTGPHNTALFDDANTTGFYLGTRTLSQGTYDRGQNYIVRVTWAMSSSQRAQVFTFGVN